MISLIISGVILDRTRAYVTAARIIALGVLMCMIACFWIIPAGNVTVMCLTMFVMGSFVMPVYAICLPLTFKLTHPTPAE